MSAEDEGRTVKKWVAIVGTIGALLGSVLTMGVGAGVWMTRLQVKQEIHHALPAHPAAADMLNQANLTISLQNQAIQGLSATVDRIEAQQRELEAMFTEMKYGRE